MKIYKNGFSFEIVRRYLDTVVIEIKEGGVIHHSFVSEKASNLTTNTGGGLKEYIDDNY